MKSFILLIFLALAAGGGAYLAWQPVADLGWLGQDSITAVESSRFADLDGFLALFGRSLMQDTGFVFDYYRPATTVSFGVNHLLSGLDPRGYHIVDLSILAATAALVFLACVLMPRRRCSATYRNLSALVAALVFAVHSVHLTVVPVAARRSEGQIVLFGLAGLVLILGACRTRGKARILLLALAPLAFALSILSKEAGVLYLPPAAILLAFGLRGESRPGNLARLFLGLLGAGAIAGILFWLRNRILDAPSMPLHINAESFCRNTWDFVLTPIYPIRLLGYDAAWRGRWIPLILGMAPVLVLAGWLATRLVPEGRARRIAGLCAMAAGAAVTAWTAVALLDHAYSAAVRPRPGFPPVAEWSDPALVLTAGGIMGWILALSVLLCGVSILVRLLVRKQGSDPRDAALGWITWILSTWALVTATGLYSFRNSLGPTAALMPLLLLAFDACAARLFRARNDEEAEDPAPRVRLPARLGALAGVSAILGLALTFAVWSHVFRNYVEWERLDQASTAYLDAVAEAAREADRTGVEAIELSGVPASATYMDRYPKALSLAGFTDHTVAAWLRWHLGETPGVSIMKRGRKRLHRAVRGVRVESRREGNRLILEAVYRH